MAKIIDGKSLATRIKAEIKAEIERDKLNVGLAVVIVGNDRASEIYVKYKKDDCAECGIQSFEYALPEYVCLEDLLELIEELNDDENINGILVQQPLPRHIDAVTVNETISPFKDVDAFRADSLGKIALGDYDFSPCTPAGIMEMLHNENISVSGKECVVIGRSAIVGKPMALMLLHEDATVTICHSKTRDLGEAARRADVLVAAAGCPGLVGADMVKEGAVVIDVGMNRDESGKLCGDVKFAEVSGKASYITPVPGGVGPMTRAMLMKNALMAKRLQL
ncbi:MAG: bifunctional methylenetetrahydrofolate dehydrogenase/methenyltetrahydrofolate cyclohydrolase FolD [Oscillospiraceae bacterium]|jgi:methylenetetrahydrofolate dehydrogenase (NADP+)/methenyltetrahydrofolate cyclohydrolase|nr:bifunctional methylenetetrahydrofolate dehydrogenase/methenyltetrahydrofolate cyclohydrolase FolD [Oscillospiraceae bacterium]